MEYRKDIQILRGLAVLLVVFFHLGLPGFNSGFLGVDVFFVISGYLMAIMYDPANKADFFLKRARRLLPAYVGVVIATLTVSLFLTIPNEFVQVSKQAWFALPFASNIGFWMENSYFDKASFKPLLHLWSLGVEIQFYLLVPALCWLFNKVKFSYAVLLAGSAAMCFVVVGVSPKTAFFWLPFRLWEFLIGYGVAKFIYQNGGSKRAPCAWLGAAALAAISCIPFLSLDGQALGFRHGHPGLIALLISLATATTLSFGLPFRMVQHPLATALETLGKYSYSVYLAHFPVIVLFLYQPFSGTILKATSPGQTLTMALLVGAASALLYTFVERPFRAAGKASWPMAFIGAFSVLGISVFGPLGQKALAPARETLIFAASEDRSAYRCGKLNRVLDPTSRSCAITPAIAAPSHRVLLVGNSHADAIKTEFAAAAQAGNVAVQFMVENDPLMQGGITPQGLVAEALRLQVDTIVLHFSPNTPFGLEQVVEAARAHQLRVALVMPVPVWERHIPMALWKHARGMDVLPVQDIHDYRKNNQGLIDLAGKVDYDRFRIYPVGEVLCRDACAIVADDGKPLYFDQHHLTLTGSARLRAVFDQVIRDLK